MVIEIAGLAQFLGTMGAGVKQGIIEAERETLQQSKQAAIPFSSGPYSQSDLNAMGNPYATAHPAPPADPAIINAGGPFASEWGTRGPTTQGNTITSTLLNNDPAGRFFAGTRRMIPRPVIEAIAAEVSPERQKRLDDAINEALESR